MAVIDSAYRERLTADSLLIDHVELGSAGLGQNTFRARITNLTNRRVAVGLDLRTIPGLWLVAAWQNQFAIEIPPRGTRAVEEQYQFRRLSPEAVLRVRIGGVKYTADARPLVTPVLLERRYPVGRGNPAAFDPRASFDLVQTEHLDIYVGRGSLAQSRIQLIEAERENGLRLIEEILGVRLTTRIRLVFYPDSATKTRETGHIGNGFASDGSIVEIYNAETQLNPYHEIAHIVGGQLGDPPALFDEGFATYVSERLGTPALRSLGHADAKIDDVVCRVATTSGLIPVPQLFRFTEIGSAASRAAIAYPEAASLVKYLIELRGLALFREAYRTLRSTDDSAEVAANEEAFARIFGESLAAIEASWRRYLACQNDRW
jgi:hypothetical protein